MDDPTMLSCTPETSLHAERSPTGALHLSRKTCMESLGPFTIQLAPEECRAVWQWLTPSPSPLGLPLDEMATILSASGYLVALDHTDLEALMLRLAAKYGYVVTKHPIGSHPRTPQAIGDIFRASGVTCEAMPEAARREEMP